MNTSKHAAGSDHAPWCGLFRPRLLILAVVLASLTGAPAWGDILVFDATTNPITGLDLLSGPLPDHQGFVGFVSTSNPMGGPGSPDAYFYWGQPEFAAEDPTNPLPCYSPAAGICYNDPHLFFAADGSPMDPHAVPAVIIKDLAGNRIATIGGSCTVDAICSFFFYKTRAGDPYLDSTHEMIAGAGIQEAIRVKYYDGTSDTIAFQLAPIPEPRPVYLLGAVAMVLLAQKRLSRGRARSS